MMNRMVLRGFAIFWLALGSSMSFAQSVTPSQWASPLNSATVHTQLSAYKGKVLWVDFWASWCPPCRVSFPWMNQIQRRYAQNGLQVIGINVDEDSGDARQFLQTHPASFQVYFDPKGDAPSRFNVQGMPTSYLIDRQGHIRMIHIGFKPEQKAELEQKIRQALSE